MGKEGFFEFFSGVSGFPESEELEGAVEGEGGAVFPWGGWGEDGPILGEAECFEDGEGIDEELLLGEEEEGEVGAGIGEGGLRLVDAVGAEAGDFFDPFMVGGEEFWEKGGACWPVEEGAVCLIEAEGLGDGFDPDFGAGGGEDEVGVLGFEGVDLGDDFGVGDFWEPVGDEIFDV